MRHTATHREGDAPVPPLRAVGPYEVLALLGKGSSGLVLLARRPGVERLFAVKLLPPDLDAEGLARLRREAEVASRLDHPGIVQVHDVGVHLQQPYLVMDHVPGPTLKDVIDREGARPSGEAAALVAELAEALEVAHRGGIVHRDLKPANVIVDGRDGRAKVTDFGLARDLSRPSDLTQPGAVLGTPYYMAPEQVRGEPVDARADVYALGVILYELLTGARPFEAPSVSELGWKILEGRPAPPSARREGVDPRVEAVCLAAMGPRDARPASARALAVALRAACAAPLTGAARRPVRGALAAGLAAGPAVAVALAAGALTERRRARALAGEADAAAAQVEALAARAADARLAARSRRASAPSPASAARRRTARAPATPRAGATWRWRSTAPAPTATWPSSSTP
ncbi:MAG: serine/threonine protein kinase [Planctomycetes bacterium]|nr:serine/threonine protein kinase [Planctomycetota bacterium]